MTRSTEKSDRFSVDRVVVMLPGLAALGLAVLYGTGAMLKTAEFRGEGLPVNTTLPLLSLEDMLARGISAFFGAAVTGAVVLATVIGTHFYGLRREKDRIESRERRQKERQAIESEVRCAKRQHESERLRTLLDAASVHAETRVEALSRTISVTGVALWILGGVVVIGGFFAAPPTFYLTFVLVGLTTIIFGDKILERFALWQIFLAVNLTMLLGIVATTWFYPQRLPRAFVTTRAGHQYRGRLVATGSTQWFVASGKTVIAIPVQEMKASSFRDEPPRTAPSTATVLGNLIGP